MVRTVLITGATSGIGKATAEAFARNGDNLVLCARRIDILETLKADWEAAYHVRVFVYELDVSDRVAVETVIGRICAEVGRIDILVNNAGLAQGLDAYQDSSTDDIERMLDTNVKGMMYVTRNVLPSMVRANFGHVINLGSTAGIYAYAGAAVYCATKAAVKTFSDGIRIDTIASNVKVTTVQPGIVSTPFSEVRFHGDKGRADAVYADIDALQAEDIADIILFVANRPKHVQISDITVMAAQQATGFMIAKGVDTRERLDEA